MKREILISLLLLLILGCGKKSLPPKDYFTIKVITTKGGPIFQATIEGGFDWEFFRVKTDSNGVAILPGYARGKSAVIYKNNFFPRSIQSLASAEYALESTPKQFKLVGKVNGWSIRFDSEKLITIGYGGDYHVYLYNDQGITEMASTLLPKCIKETQLCGDTLWFSTHDDGVYMYSIQNPLQPEKLFHFEISGYLGPFAVKDTIIVIGSTSSFDSLRTFSYKPNGEYEEISKFGQHLVVKMAFRSNYLIVTNYYENLPVVYDLEDPMNPQLIYNGVEPEYWSGFLFENYLILIPRWEYIGEITNYKLIDLSNPTNPSPVGLFSADSRLLQIVNDSTAIGIYHTFHGANSVLRGNLTTGFKTIAIISEGLSSEILGGFYPPYYVICGYLWKMEE